MNGIRTSNPFHLLFIIVSIVFLSAFSNESIDSEPLGSAEGEDATRKFAVFSNNASEQGFSINPNVEQASPSLIYIWDGSFDSDIDMQDAESYQMNLQWNPSAEFFGGGIMSTLESGADLRAYSGGVMVIEMKIPSDISFQIGITDILENENWIGFTAETTNYGLEYGDVWSEVRIPIAELTGGNIDLSKVVYAFALKSIEANLPAQTFEASFRNVYWEVDK